jgi:hypothetical protein
MHRQTLDHSPAKSGLLNHPLACGNRFARPDGAIGRIVQRGHDFGRTRLADIP